MSFLLDYKFIIADEGGKKNSSAVFDGPRWKEKIQSVINDVPFRTVLPQAHRLFQSRAVGQKVLKTFLLMPWLFHRKDVPRGLCCRGMCQRSQMWKVRSGYDHVSV